MKAISLHEPYASLMASGWKRIETRSRRTHHRGFLAIHAAKRWTAEQEQRCRQFPFSECVNVDDIKAHLGKIRCIVTVYDCVPTRKIDAITGMEGYFGDYTPGRFGWLTRDMIKLKNPIAVVGRQGMFEVPLYMCGPCDGLGIRSCGTATLRRCDLCEGSGFVGMAA